MRINGLLFLACKAIGFALLYIHWINSGEAAGFFLLLALLVMTVFRLRMPGLWYTIIIDGAALWIAGHYLVLCLFLVSEVFYRTWENEYRQGLRLRDAEAGKYYELEQLQGDLLTAAAQVERMTSVSERARIAGEIHDNAGHEVVSAYISLQTARELLAENSSDQSHEALELYDIALTRLDRGVLKIREAVHNLAPVTALGIEVLHETCRRFPGREVEFNTFGDMSNVPVYCWNLLESCLNEALTNVARHANAKRVKVDVDAAPNIVRLSVENDGSGKAAGAPGIGLRNLRRRAAAVGGNISIDAGEVFRVICVVPIRSIQNESNNR